MYIYIYYTYIYVCTYIIVYIYIYISTINHSWSYLHQLGYRLGPHPVMNSGWVETEWEFEWGDSGETWI